MRDEYDELEYYDGTYYSPDDVTEYEMPYALWEDDHDCRLEEWISDIPPRKSE